MPESHATHPNVVPLIDIIMCLIIFFMLVAKIGVKTGEDKEIKIPLAKLGKSIKDTGNLLINVKETNGQPEITAMVEGEVKPFTLESQSTGRQLKDMLARLHFGEDMKPGGTGGAADIEKFAVVIRGDGNMKYRTLEKVLLSCAYAKVDTINFQADKSKGGR